MKTIAEYDFENLPVRAMEALEGISEDADNQLEIEVWLVDLNLPIGHRLWSFSNDTHFSWKPEFGLACECVEAKLKICEA